MNYNHGLFNVVVLRKESMLIAILLEHFHTHGMKWNESVAHNCTETTKNTSIFGFVVVHGFEKSLI